MAKPKSISWILDFTSKLDDIEKVKCLQANDNSAMRTILKYALDPNIKWQLPPGDPPYKPQEENDDLAIILYQEARKLYLFIEGGNPNLRPMKRESLFIDLLQRVDPNDAKMILAFKDKKMPFKGITPEIVNQAYPGLI